MHTHAPNFERRRPKKKMIRIIFPPKKTGKNSRKIPETCVFVSVCVLIHKEKNTHHVAAHWPRF